MHIPDGMLPVAVIAGGYVATGALTWYSIRKVNQLENPQAEIPKVALLTAAFFVSSSIHIPVPPTSVHLLLSGLMGALLGWFAMPAIVIGLVLQAIMFGHGGITTIGVNALVLGVPALLAHFLFQWFKGDGSSRWRLISAGILAGAVGVGVTVLIFFSLLINFISADLIDPAAERRAIIGLALAHLPLLFIEGGMTGMLIGYLARVKPELIGFTREQINQQKTKPYTGKLSEASGD